MKINAKTIAIEMARQDMTYTDLVKRSGLSVHGIIEIRKRGECTPRSAGKIARALGIPVERLLEDGEPEDHEKRPAKE